MSDAKGWYAEREPEFPTSGKFEAVIYAADRPVAQNAQGHSYAAVAIRQLGDIPYQIGVPTSDGASEEYRAYIAAAVAVVEALQYGSSAKVYSHNPSIVTTFNSWLPTWVRNGWFKNSGAPIAALEIFKRYWSVLKARGLEIEWVLEPKEGGPHESVFRELADQIEHAHQNKSGNNK